jgi:hypothetical protein
VEAAVDENSLLNTPIFVSLIDGLRGRSRCREKTQGLARRREMRRELMVSHLMNKPERFAAFANGKGPDRGFAHTVAPSRALATARQQFAVIPD